MRPILGRFFLACCAAAAVATFSSSCGKTQRGQNAAAVGELSSSALVIQGAKLIDGSGGPPIDNAVIVVDGGVIRAAGHASAVAVPKGAAVYNANGKTVIPGLVDAHVHYFGDAAAMKKAFLQQLAFGITTVRSIGTDRPEHLDTIAQARAGAFPAPRIFTAGLGFTHPKGHPAAIPFVNRPATADQARAQVDELATRKVDFIKMWVESKGGTLPKISPEIQTAIINQARRYGIPVVAHIFDEADLRRLAGAGLTEFLHTVRDKPFPDAALIEFAKDRNLTFTPTLTVIDSNWYFAEHPEELDDPQLRIAADPAVLGAFRSPEFRASRQVASNQARKEFAAAKRFIAALRKAGVALVAGSDSNGGTIPHGWGTHHEMSLLVEAGLQPLEAVRAATGAAAAALAHDARFGVIKANNTADLVVLSDNPEQEIRNTRKIQRVMVSGKWVDFTTPQ